MVFWELNTTLRYIWIQSTSPPSFLTFICLWKQYGFPLRSNWSPFRSFPFWDMAYLPSPKQQKTSTKVSGELYPTGTFQLFETWQSSKVFTIHTVLLQHQCKEMAIGKTLRDFIQQQHLLLCSLLHPAVSLSTCLIHLQYIVITLLLGKQTAPLSHHCASFNVMMIQNAAALHRST